MKLRWLLTVAVLAGCGTVHAAAAPPVKVRTLVIPPVPSAYIARPHPRESRPPAAVSPPAITAAGQLPSPAPVVTVHPGPTTVPPVTVTSVPVTATPVTVRPSPTTVPPAPVTTPPATVPVTTPATTTPPVTTAPVTTPPVSTQPATVPPT